MRQHRLSYKPSNLKNEYFYRVPLILSRRSRLRLEDYKIELPGCLRCPAASSAYGPLPQKKSARPGPVIAPPVSWFNMNRRQSTQVVIFPRRSTNGLWVTAKVSAAGGKSFLSNARDRPGVSVTFREPRGPSA